MNDADFLFLAALEDDSLPADRDSVTDTAEDISSEPMSESPSSSGGDARLVAEGPAAGQETSEPPSSSGSGGAADIADVVDMAPEVDDPVARWEELATATAQAVSPRTDAVARRVASINDELSRAAVTALLNAGVVLPPRAAGRQVDSSSSPDSAVEIDDVVNAAIRAVCRSVPQVVLADPSAARHVLTVAVSALMASSMQDLAVVAPDATAPVDTELLRSALLEAAAGVVEHASARAGIPARHGRTVTTRVRRVKALAQIASMSDEEREQKTFEARLRRMSGPERAAARRAEKDAQERRDAARQWSVALRQARGRYAIIEALLTEGHSAVVRMLEACKLTSTSTRERTNPDGSTTRITEVAAPRLTDVYLTRRGLRLEVDPLPGQPLSAWEAASGGLSTELCHPVSVSQDGRHITVDVQDRVATLPESAPVRDAPQLRIVTSEWSSVNRRGEPVCHLKERVLLPFGIGPAGDVLLELSDQPGLVVGGVSGSGKTASLKTAMSALVGRTELHIVDGKSEMDWLLFKAVSASFDRSGELPAAAAIIARVESIRALRGRAIAAFSETLPTRPPSASFWDLPVTAREAAGLYPICLIIDECQIYTEKQGSMDSESKQLQQEILDALAKLIRLGRSAGVFTVLATQKPTAETIPTRLRDNVASRLCLRVANREAAVAVLASGVYNEAPIKPDRIPTNKRGRAVLAGTDDGLVEVVQCLHITDGDLQDFWQENPPNAVPDQLTVCQQLINGGRRPTEQTPL